MKIVCISDTHGQHFGLYLPKGDTIIHSGDFCNRGEMIDCVRFFNWFGTLPFKNKIVIAGNHDLWMEKANPSEIKAIIPPGVIYLNDSGVEIDGINFWGSPVQPRFFNWAFNRNRGPEIRKHWDKIPNNTDVLITHGPPYSILDEAPRDYGTEKVGCEDLLNKVKKLRPKLHVFGHIHYSYGHSYTKDTLFVNASLVNEDYQMVGNAILVDISSGTAKVIHKEYND